MVYDFARTQRVKGVVSASSAAVYGNVKVGGEGMLLKWAKRKRRF